MVVACWHDGVFFSQQDLQPSSLVEKNVPWDLWTNGAVAQFLSEPVSMADERETAGMRSIVRVDV